MEWISIKDKLPIDVEHCDLILVYGKSSDSGIRMFSLALFDGEKFELELDDEGFTHCMSGPWTFEAKDITHWCLLEFPNTK